MPWAQWICVSTGTPSLGNPSLIRGCLENLFKLCPRRIHIWLGNKSVYCLWRRTYVYLPRIYATHVFEMRSWIQDGQKRGRSVGSCLLTYTGEWCAPIEIKKVGLMGWKNQKLHYWGKLMVNATSHKNLTVRFKSCPYLSVSKKLILSSHVFLVFCVTLYSIFLNLEFQSKEHVLNTCQAPSIMLGLGKS